MFKYLVKKQNIFSLFLIAIIFAAFYCPLLKNINSPIDNSDYQRFYYQIEVLRKICLEYGQFPLRNPFLSGGYPISGNPYIFILNPLNIYTLLFGTVAGIRLSIFSLLIFCAFGMFYLTRYILRYNCAGSIFSTLVFMLSGWGVFHVKGGDYDKLYFYLLPWLLAFFIKSKTDRRFIILAALFFGLMLVEGHLIIVSLSIFLFIYALLKIAISFKGNRFKIDLSFAKILLAVLILATLLYAVKIVPMISLLQIRSADYVHFANEHSYEFVSSLSNAKGHALNISRLLALLLKDSYEGYGKINLGIIPVTFFLLSGLVFFKKNWPYLIILVFFIILSFGPNSPIDLFKLLWHVHPFVHGIWKLGKYFSFPILFLISLIGGSIFLIPERVGRFKVPLKFILITVALLGIMNMFAENKRDLTFSYLELPEIKKVNSFFQVRVKEYKVSGPFDVDIPDEKFTRFYWLSMLQGFGVANSILGADALPIREQLIHKYFVDNRYYDEVSNSASSKPMRNQKINPYYKGEVFFIKDGNQADFEYFSPNRLEVSVQVKNPPDILVINQRYDKGWRCNSGRLLNEAGLLGLEFKRKGDYLVRFRYLPVDFLLGLSISILTIIGILLYKRRYA